MWSDTFKYLLKIVGIHSENNGHALKLLIFTNYWSKQNAVRSKRINKLNGIENNTNEDQFKPVFLYTLGACTKIAANTRAKHVRRPPMHLEYGKRMSFWRTLGWLALTYHLFHCIGKFSHCYACV